ncbi:MAG: redox-regulated ATPase YchF [bacterium]|nr:redox-regulated ATPase YchF [bacterium]
MAIFVGIIGLPNVGKSTLFNTLTRAQVEASNYPFCTVEPNVGMVEVPDTRLDRLNALLSPESCTPTHIRFVDIAGLVRGASRGEGLGNQFLGHIREADALVHVVRCFVDDGIVHVDGRVDPLADVETVQTELMLADLETAETAHSKLEKVARSDMRAVDKGALDLLARAVEGLRQGHFIRDLGFEGEAAEKILTYRFLTAKPTLYLANVSEDTLPTGGTDVERLRERFGCDRVLAVSGKIESELLDLTAEDRLMFLEDLGLSETGLNRLILAGYGLLNLVTFYTLAKSKLQAWQLVAGTGAQKAAGKIHSDMEKGFIRAEVAACEDLLDQGSYDKLRHLGKLRTEGRDYVVKDGDVIEFLFKA